MAFTINEKLLDNYSNQLSQHLADQLYESDKFVTGIKLLEGGPIQQVNLLILFLIYHKWQSETGQLRSNFFDYQNSEVKEALQRFLNVLSKHIQLDKPTFQTIAPTAVKSSILLALAPSMVFHPLFHSKPVHFEELKGLLKYLRLNKRSFETLCSQIHTAKTHTCDELQIQLEQLIDLQSSLLEPSSLMLELNKLVAINEADLFLNLTSGVVNIEETLENQGKNTEIIQSHPVNTPPNTFIAEGPQTINELLAHQDSSLHNKLLKTKVENVKNAIPINKRFLFLNQLFGGNIDDYNQALQDIEGSDDYNQAIKSVNDKYATKYSWTIDNPAIEELYELIDRRFL